MKAFFIFAVALISVASAKKPDYYWREYDGKIPMDAVKVAQKGSDERVYVGQGFFKGVGLLPGMIKAGVMELNAVANGRVYTIKENIKILASDSDDIDRDFQWISTNYMNFESLRNLHFIRVPSGGSESDTDVFIGRHSETGYTNIGKIYTLEPYQGLTIPDAQGVIKVYKNFEFLAILNFDCNKNEYGYGFEESNENSAGMFKFQRPRGLPLGQTQHKHRMANFEDSD